MSHVELTLNGMPLKGIPFNDPSDAEDWCIVDDKMPREMFIKKEPDIGWSWEDLPFRWGWNGNIYRMFVVTDEYYQERKDLL